MSVAAEPDLLQLAAEVLDHVPPGEAEAVITERELALTRFARNRIHQNVTHRGTELRVRLQHDGRTGVASVPVSARDAVGTVLERAETARRLSPAAALAPLPEPDGTPDTDAGWSEATATASPDLRAEGVAAICRHGVDSGVDTFGAFSTERVRIAVANTRGLRRLGRRTSARVVTVARGRDGAGYAERGSVDVGRVDAAAAGAEAVSTCLRNQDAATLEPGDYEVVFTPYAFAELVLYLSSMGFGALAKLEERSFMRIGERLAAAGLTIRDDGTDAEVLPFPFDAEGVSRRAVTLIERGVCRAFVYDTPTALRDGVTSTGHARPLPNTLGPLADRLVIDAGEADGIDALVSAVRRGLLVTRLWYIRPVHDLRTIVTGMTREGTFLIEHGRVVHPVRDLRFTQSIIAALADVRGLSRERLLTLDSDGFCVLAPAAHVGTFSFTS